MFSVDGEWNKVNIVRSLNNTSLKCIKFCIYIGQEHVLRSQIEKNYNLKCILQSLILNL